MNLLNSKTLTQKICYIHVSKCAGSSIIDAIREHYSFRHRIMGHIGFVNMDASASFKGSQIFKEDLWSYREKLLLYFLSINKNKLVVGHFPFSDLVVSECKKEWKFITTLRHPVDRWFSLYFFNRYKRNEHFKTDLSLHEYVESVEGKSSGSHYHKIFSGLQENENISFEESHLKVIDNINKLDCVGVTEDMGTFCEDFKKSFGVQLKIKTKNKSPLSEKERSRLVKGSIKQKVENICEPDLKIYNYVLERIHSK